MRFMDDTVESGGDSVRAPGCGTSLGRFTSDSAGCAEKPGHVSPKTFSTGACGLSDHLRAEASGGHVDHHTVSRSGPGLVFQMPGKGPTRLKIIQGEP